MQSSAPRWRPAFAALNQSATWLGLGLVVLVWTSLTFHLRSDLATTHETAAASAAGAARSVEAFSRHAVAEIDGILIFLRTAWDRDPESFTLADFTRDGTWLGDLSSRVTMTDPAGRALRGSDVPSPGSDAAARAHFSALVRGGADDVYIGRPVAPGGGGGGGAVVPVSRALRGRDGAFAGLVTATLDPALLAVFFDAIDVGREDTITLVGDDGIVRAVGGPGRTADRVGAQAGGLVEHVRAGTAGVFTQSDAAGDALVAWRRVGAYPLVVKVAAPMGPVLAPFAAKSVRFHAAAGLFTLLVLLVIGYGARRNGRLLTAEAALRASEAQASRKSQELALTLEHMSQGILMVDGDGTVAVMNRRAAALLDLPESFIASRPNFADILRYQWEQGEFGQDVPPQVLDYIKSGGLAAGMAVYERTRPSGTVLEVRNTPLPDGGLVRTYTDITERSKAATALAAARDAAEAAGRARSAFLAMMSHEIRTPLNGVIGMADLLLETPLNDEQGRYVGTLRHSADHLLQIINDVLDFSKLEADRVELDDIVFDLEEMVDSVIEIVAPRAFEKGLFIAATVDPALPDRACGDPAALRQILLNLVGNAVKFTPAGHIHLDVGPDPEARARGRLGLLVRVRDTGIGIPSAAIPSLFREFAQVDGSISRRFGGTGLGLAISRQLVERMGGTIGVTSTEGEGSVFTFTAVLKPAPEARPIGNPDLSGHRILVMSAGAVARDHYAALLRRGQAWVEVAADPRDALARLRQPGAIAFRTVLVDEASGDRESAVLAEAVRSDLALAGLRMVLATTASHRLAPGSIHRMAFDRVLGKPASRRDVMAAVLGEEAVVDTAPEAEAEAAATPAGARGHVLLAEDNATNRLVVGTLLRKLGYACRTVENGLEAVAAVQEEPFDLILMDVMMPEMDGYAATRAIRALAGEAGRTPIVALTANVLTADIKEALAAGMDDFATKPISRDKLEQVIQKTLEKRRAHAAPPPALEAADRPETDGDGGAFDPTMLKLLLDEIDPQSARTILSVFVEDTTERLARMLTRLDDRVLIARECHALKSAAATFGLNGVSARAAELEEGAAQMSPDALAASLAALSRAFADGRARLPAPAPPGGATTSGKRNDVA